MQERYFITGISTNVGKTLVSAILAEALEADYWKPVQSGYSEASDTETVKQLISNYKSKFHKEAFLLKEPLSPHQAARNEGIEIDLSSLIVPKTNNNLIIEGAGGPLVPLNDKHLVIDIAKKSDADIILVVNNYLGCINHALLCLEYFFSNNLPLCGIVLNGNFDPQVEKAIVSYKPVNVLARIPFTFNPNKYFVSQQAGQVDKKVFNEHFAKR